MKPQIFSSDKEKQLSKKITETTLPLNNINVANKTILITGAAQGIGHTLAMTAARAGAELVLLDKSIPALETLYDDVMAIDGAIEPFLLPVEMAGANLDDYLQLAENLDKHINKLDGIIHNAAHFAGLFALMQTPPEDLIKHIQVNYTAPIWLTQAMFTLLQKSDMPTLLFADHQESYDDNVAYYNTYAGAKIALMQAVKQLALEHESVNLFAYGYNTGWVNTALARQVFPHAKEEWVLVQDANIACKILSLFNREEVNGSVVDFS